MSVRVGAREGYNPSNAVEAARRVGFKVVENIEKASDTTAEQTPEQINPTPLPDRQRELGGVLQGKVCELRLCDEGIGQE